MTALVMGLLLASQRSGLVLTTAGYKRKQAYLTPLSCFLSYHVISLACATAILPGMTYVGALTGCQYHIFGLSSHWNSEPNKPIFFMCSQHQLFC
jgi:hypothetical protein